MPVLTLEKPDPEDEGWQVIPDGLSVLGEVTSVGTKVMPFNDDNGDQVVRLHFEFRVVEGTYKGFRVEQDVYNEFKISPRNRLYQWVLALYDVDTLEPKFQLDTDTLVGRRAVLTVGIRTWERQDGRGEGQVNTIKYLHRAMPTQAAPALRPQPVQQAAAYDEDPF